MAATKNDSTTTIKSVVKSVGEMSVKDLEELVQAFEKKFGVSAADLAAGNELSGSANPVNDLPAALKARLTQSNEEEVATKTIRRMTTSMVRNADEALVLLEQTMEKLNEAVR